MTPVAYAVPRWLAATFVLGALAAAGAAWRTPPPGRFLFLVVAVAAGAEAVRAVLLRPTLRADERGIEVVAGFRRERHPWAAVDAVTTLARPQRSIRRGGDALEIDLGERLVLVPSYRLGAPADEVATTLRAFPS
jgi:hypothetical protein